MNLDTRLFVPDAVSGEGLQPVLAASLRSRPAPAGAPDRLLWPASFFGLDRVALYREASRVEQEAMLRGCNDGVLTELYFIEKSGMYFASKMALLAERLLLTNWSLRSRQRRVSRPASSSISAASSSF